jgi:hypothetical protein
MSLQGFEGVSADEINVQVVNTRKLYIDRFKSKEGSLSVDGDLNLDKAVVLDSLEMQTADLTLSLNNDDLRPRDVSGQLVAPGTEFWLDTRGFELRTNARVSRYSDPLVMFFYRLEVPQALEELSAQRLSAEYIMQTRMREPPLLETSFSIPESSSYSERTVNFGSQTVNTAEQNLNGEADVPPADEILLEISSR